MFPSLDGLMFEHGEGLGGHNLIAGSVGNNLITSLYIYAIAANILILLLYDSLLLIYIILKILPAG